MTKTNYEAASVQQTMDTVNRELRTRGGAYSEYSCKTVSWDDVQRGTVGGGLSCWGANITDTRLWEKSGTQLFTVRSDNWNEKLGKVSADEVALITGNQRGEPLAPVTLRDFLKHIGREGQYAGLDRNTDLSCALDSEVSIRFQTTFLPVADEQLAALEFAPEMYNYQTRSDADPRNLLVLATTQGVAVQQDGAGAKKLYHHAVDPATPGEVCRYWFEAERSRHKVGQAQQETKEEALEAAQRGKATAAVIGTRAMGTRFNVLLTVQVPLKQKTVDRPRGGGGGGGSLMLGGGGPGGFPKKKSACGLGLPIAMAATKSCASMASSGEEDEEQGCEDDDEMMMDAMEGTAEAAPEIEEIEEMMMASEEAMMGLAEVGAAAAAPEEMMMGSRCRAAAPRKAPPARGTANAARVSRGSMVDRWGGLRVRAPTRDDSQHVTVTAVIYNTVAGGVPSAEDVVAAVDDMERLYAACGWHGKLAQAGANFMKKELTVGDAAAVGAKLGTQPYVPPAGAAGLVLGGDAFPNSAPGA